VSLLQDRVRDRLPRSSLTDWYPQRLLDDQKETAPDVRTMHGVSRQDVVEDCDSEKDICRQQLGPGRTAKHIEWPPRHRRGQQQTITAPLIRYELMRSNA
jgi:hypothetical protein